jgi:catechol 2,3-dioxygenase-like lactoylglutathione lyase family enzyme
MKLKSIDHIVLTVASIDKSVEFYCRFLGFDEIMFGVGRKALQCGSQKINLHQVGAEFLPHAKHPTSGSGDICLVYEDDLDSITRHVNRCEIEIEEGPVARTGAMGPITSIYIRDPDFNLIELSVYEET